MTDPRPFEPEIGADEVSSLRARLALTRWPEPATEPDHGPALDEVRRLVEHWRDGYDWDRYRTRIGSVPQVVTEVDGLDIHAIHVPSTRPDAVPVVLTHGWPSTCYEFLDVVPLLTEPEEGPAFHVVVPSLPGYGWSGKPTGPGWGVERIADAWVELMGRLGYDDFVAQGGDWGSLVSTEIAVRHPSRLRGLHLTMPTAPSEDADRRDVPPSQRRGLEREARYRAEGYAYAMVNRTRPQTIGYALVDSPAGLCAWIGEKLADWSGTDADGRPLLDDDAVLDVVSTYWLTSSAASAARLYREAGRLARDTPVDVPTGCSVFPEEIIRPPRSAVARRYRDLRYWNEPERGGHFPAAELPEVFAAELRAFVATL